jgi:D-galactarolactone cycloisomerase
LNLALIEAIPVRLRREWSAAKGTAGSPTDLTGHGDYRWSAAYPVLYSTNFETAIIKITTDSGLVGWGEAQAPLAPEVACTIIDRLLAPILTDTEFQGSVAEIEALWSRMYSAMRVRGQTGGFMLDAISGIDIALWDLAGKIVGQPVSELLAPGIRKTRIPAYLSGVNGATEDDRVAFARSYADQGFHAVKLYYESDWASLLHLAGRIRERSDVAIDALWHLDPKQGIDDARRLDDLSALWLECPFMPEDLESHATLAEAIKTPIALGESYRTTWELKPFFDAGAVGIIQPDLGRCGITESRRIAELGARHGASVAPHISIALGP